MPRDLFAALSFGATILFALLALGGLLVASLVLDDRAALVCALLVCSVSYVSQLFTSWSVHPEVEAESVPWFERIGAWLQLAACVLWLAGLLFLL